MIWDETLIGFTQSLLKETYLDWS